ncbi:MAG: YfbK domain-containing protein [Bacteroidota bacterium]
MVHELTTDVRSVEETSCNYRWATAIAAYSLLLQDSDYTGVADLQLVEEIAINSLGDDPYGIRRAFLNQLTNTAELLARTGQN